MGLDVQVSLIKAEAKILIRTYEYWDANETGDVHMIYKDKFMLRGCHYSNKNRSYGSQPHII